MDAGNVTGLHVFQAPDGYLPTGLVQGSDGFLYGTTLAGGHSFNIADGNGIFPNRSLVLGYDGFLYGTAEGGGAVSVNRIDSSGNFNYVNQFDGADGFGPTHPVLQTSDGFFFGTTHQGGLLDFQGGDIFCLDSNDNLEVLHSFVTAAGSGGFIPNSELIKATDGGLYGATGRKPDRTVG